MHWMNADGLVVISRTQRPNRAHALHLSKGLLFCLREAASCQCRPHAPCQVQLCLPQRDMSEAGTGHRLSSTKQHSANSLCTRNVIRIATGNQGCKVLSDLELSHWKLHAWACPRHGSSVAKACEHTNTTHQNLGLPFPPPSTQNRPSVKVGT